MIEIGLTDGVLDKFISVLTHIDTVAGVLNRLFTYYKWNKGGGLKHRNTNENIQGRLWPVQGKTKTRRPRSLQSHHHNGLIVTGSYISSITHVCTIHYTLPTACLRNQLDQAAKIKSHRIHRRYVLPALIAHAFGSGPLDLFRVSCYHMK